MFYDYEYEREDGLWYCQDSEGVHGVGDTKYEAWMNLQEVRADSGMSKDSRYESFAKPEFRSVYREKPMDKAAEDYKWDNRL